MSFRFAVQITRPGMRAAAAIAAACLAAGLYGLGSQPMAAGLFPAPWDKLAHVLVFSAVGFAMGVASGWSGWKMVAACLVGALAVGVVDEWNQIRVPGRKADWSDLMADALGGLLGAGFLGTLQHAATRYLRHR